MTDLTTFGELREVYWMDHQDLDAHMKDEYGHDFCFGAENEKAHESCQSYEVDGEVADYDNDDLQTYKDQGYCDQYDVTGLLLNDMCSRGVIEAGFYVIENKGH